MHQGRTASGALESGRPGPISLTMETLYTSDRFIVVHLQAATPEVRHGFEIVDRWSQREVYLDGAWAELFARQLQRWQQQSPTQEEVEDALEHYAGLAQTPVALH